MYLYTKSQRIVSIGLNFPSIFHYFDNHSWLYEARTMISSKAVNDVDVVPQGMLVLLGYQVRPDVRLPPPNALLVLSTQEQVVGSHLACHREALLLGCLDD